MKTCIKCETAKPLEQFSKDKTRRDGLFPYCKLCARPYARESSRRAKSREKVPPPEFKTCTKCKLTKPISEFYPNNQKRDGYSQHCKKCCGDRSKLYQNTPKGKTVRQKVMKKYNRKLAQEHPNKPAARHAVSNAVKKGTLPKASTLPCRFCPDQAKQYHHESYDKPNWLNVVPVCKGCHDKIHSH